MLDDRRRSADDLADMRPLSIDEPRIVLTWLTRLRWLAVIGQVGATVAAVVGLGLNLPVIAIASVIAITAMSNVLLHLRRFTPERDGWLLPTVVMLDVVLLTAALALSGGPDNPFCLLYVVHVVLAVLLLGPTWTWIVVAASAVCYALLFAGHVSFQSAGATVPIWAKNVGTWLALVLSCVLIAYFIGKLYAELRSSDAELSSMRERAERSARFAAVTALAAGAAHELGSPLGTIAVVAKELELSAAQSGASSDVIDDAQLIRTEVDRCRAILNRMRLEVGDDLRYQARIVSAREFIDGAIADLTEDRKPAVRTEVLPGAESFFLASRAVLRAVGVLLRNGFEASGDSGSVLLRLRRSPGLLVVEVQDNGTGMPPDVLKRAGEPFFTTKEMGRGMGMGLFLVKLVVENNGGRLLLKSEPGQGTLATIELPDNSTGEAVASDSAPAVAART